MTLTLEEEIKSLRAWADRCEWVGMQTDAGEYRQLAEWLEELVELRKRLSDD